MSYPELIQKLVRNKYYCVTCGYTVQPENMRMRIDTEQVGDKHVTTTDYHDALWIYMECPKCSYQSALWKMVKDMVIKRTHPDI